MSKSTSKRAFVAPQPSVSNRVFATRLASYRAAAKATDDWTYDPSNEDASEADLSTRSNAEGVAQNALIATPAQTTTEVAEKVNALFRRWAGGKGDLSNPADRRAVAAWPDDGYFSCTDRDYGQSLLALYLDLTGLPSPMLPARAKDAEPVSAAWLAATVAHNEATAAKEDIAAREKATDEDLGDEYNAARAAEADRLDELMNVRAPDVASMAEKARRLIAHVHLDWIDEPEVDAAVISRLLGDDDWTEGGMVAALMQDALALAGNTGPIVEAKPDPFDGSVWLAETRARTGTVIEEIEGGKIAFPSTPDAPGAAMLASAAFSDLRQWQRSEVELLVWRENEAAQRKARADAPVVPSDPAATRLVFLETIERMDGVQAEAHAARSEATAVLELAARINATEGPADPALDAEWQARELALVEMASRLPNEPRYIPVKAAALRGLHGHDRFHDLIYSAEHADNASDRLLNGVALALAQEAAR